MFDYTKLLGLMRKLKISQRKLAEISGICYATLNLKFCNKGFFNQEEIYKISKILNISSQKIGEYFYVKYED